MTSLIKNQILKHLTKFFKDLAPEQLQLSAFKGSCELSNLQLEEKVLMDLVSFPAWVKINKAVCDQLSIKIPWTKIKSVPIQMNLNEVMVEVEICEEFRDVSANEDDENNLASLLNSQAPGKYGFVDRVIDGITVTVNSILITLKSKLMSATFNLSRVILESRCPNWKPGELSLTRIKDVNRSQILLFKIVEWQTMRLEAKCLTDPNQAPLRLITNHAQCRLTIKKRLEDCSVVAARIFVIFEDILWVLTFAQFISAASFVEYIFTLIKRSPVSKKTGLLDESSSQSASNNSNSTFNISQPAPLISPMNTPMNHADKAPILTGNMSAASLLEQKFICYDLVETSLHLFIDKVDAHLYDDIQLVPGKDNRDSGGALQTTLDQIQVDCYPYSRAISDRKHWFKWFDPSPNSRRQWFTSHFAEFDLAQMRRAQDNQSQNSNKSSEEPNEDKPNATISVPSSIDEQLLSLTVLVKIKDYCMNCVATKYTSRGVGIHKFIQTDKDYHMPSEMPALYLELDYFYYFDALNRMMVYENVPDPLAFMHLSPTKLLFDSPTLLFLNSFHANLSKALVHLNDLFPQETSAPKIHCRIEILMPQLNLPAKSNSDQPANVDTSALLVKSGKITLSNSIYDKLIQTKLVQSIDKLKESPSQPINLGGTHESGIKKENSCIGDWAKVWNASLIDRITEFSTQNQLWAVQFEPVWMDFMNYDVDNLADGQRLEPIVEPFSAYSFIHLNLSSPVVESLHAPTLITSSKNVKPVTARKKRDIISILVSVMDGPILANMDKLQFSFLQRLGLHVEKLIQQIKADASSVLQIETLVEDTLELNLTAYVKDIKARLILDKKIETTSAAATIDSQKSIIPDKSDDTSVTKSAPKSDLTSVSGSHFSVLTPTRIFPTSTPSEKVFSYVCSETGDPVEVANLSDYDGPLDECLEVATDASCLLDEEAPSQSTTHKSALDSSQSDQMRKKSPLEESLLINLDEIEQSSALFAKVNLDSAPPIMDVTGSTEPSEQQVRVQPQSQEIETESISYLELSMSQLMVRRITETKRRQKI